MKNELTLVVGNWRAGLEDNFREYLESIEQFEDGAGLQEPSPLVMLTSLLDAYDEIMPELIGDPA